jgi:hypothetical protein
MVNSEQDCFHSQIPIGIDVDVWGFAQFSGAFAKLPKATISFAMFLCHSVYLSVRMEQIGSH